MKAVIRRHTKYKMEPNNQPPAACGANPYRKGAMKKEEVLQSVDLTSWIYAI